MPVKTLDLNGNWKLAESKPGAGRKRRLHTANCSTKDWLETPVPGDIHPTLQLAGRLPDPYAALNAEQCTWTGERDWWHRRSFDVPKSFGGQRVELVFDGIDTFAEIFLNGKKAGEADNMFRQYRFDVTDLLRRGAKNTLAVCVRAPLPIMDSFDTKKYFACFNTPRIFVRKSQCQFSWDWAPNLPALGIWRGVRLEAISEGVIEDVHVRTHTDGRLFFAVKVDQYGKNDKSNGHTYELEIEIEDGPNRIRNRVAIAGAKSFLNVSIPHPKLWWPNGYGDQHLYRYTLRLRRNNQVVDTRQGRFGIREVELVQEPKEDGLHGFAFRVNGKDVFCQGANWVPADSFTGTVDRDRYAHLLRLAYEAGFNMLRIWGGGIYEHDAFYDLCDELGITIWQDLMFACADIPDDDPNFSASVIPEFRYQVKRLRNHPSIVHWCGGNEKTGTFGAMMHYGDNVVRYIGRGVVNDLCPDLEYTPSSPYSHTDAGNDPSSGDTHGGCWEQAFRDDIRRFRKHINKRITVFNSEFGYHGPCLMRSVRKFIPEDKLWPLNEVWDAHIQDNPYSSLEERFMEVQEACATRLLHKPQSAADFVKTASTFHMELVREEFEHHRRRWPTNAGALIWMFNDIWPCASWALVDYYGLPKPAYYALKRACRPVLLSFREGRGAAECYLTTRLESPLSGVVEIELQTVDGELHKLAKKRVALTPDGSQLVATIPMRDIPRIPNAFLYARLHSDKHEATATQFHRLWRNITWPDPGLRMRTRRLPEKNGEHRAQVTLTTDRYARCVNLATKEDIPAYFSDNFFDLVAGETRKVTLQSPKPFDTTALQLNHWLTDWD